MTENINRAEFTRWLSPYWLEIQEKLFPLLTDTSKEKPTAQIQQIVQILEIVRIEESVSSPKREGQGRPQVDRPPLARAFVAKALLNSGTVGRADLPLPGVRSQVSLPPRGSER